jgi:hypothetical protein
VCQGHWGHHAGGPRAYHGSCCCSGPIRHAPHFWSKEQEAASLERYLESLREEAKAVEEHIAGLKAEE